VGAGAACVARAKTQALDPPIEPPGAFREDGPSGAAAAPDRWWTAFGDAGLDRVVVQALSGSLELDVAWARVAQAEAISVQSGAGRWPQVQARLSAARTQTIAPAGIPNQFANTDARNRFTASLEGSYEVDVWGRVEAAGHAAERDLLAARGSVEDAAERLVARVADTWFALAEQRAALAVLRRQAATNQQLLAVVSERFDHGLTGALDVLQQRQQALAVRTQIPLVEGRIDVLTEQLAVLAGLPPGGLDAAPPDALPELPPPPASGVPSDLLQRRADLRAAARRLEAADRRVAVALADRYPALRLSGSIGMQSYELEDLVDGFIWSVLGELLMPLVDGARRKAVVQQRRAQLRELLAGYGQILLGALLEVDQTLRNERALAEHAALAGERLAVARQTLEEARARYLRGLSDYLPTLAALQSVQQAELALLSARRQVVSNRITLYRALGGTWSADLTPPPEARR